MSLLSRLNLAEAHVVGHDFGSPVAAYAALTRPEVFRSVVLMSAPFGGAPIGGRASGVHDDLATLGRKHYQWYYSTREADENMRRCPQGVHAFLRAYYHSKSADWPGNQPFPLRGWIASELAKLPTYYVMELGKGMAETVAPYMPAREAPWLTDEELRIYASAFERTGFQGGLQWYRCRTTGGFDAELAAWAGRRIEVPSAFLSGASDWGPFQRPGALARMQAQACARMVDCQFIEGAGHWVQQEQPAETVHLVKAFLAQTRN